MKVVNFPSGILAEALKDVTFANSRIICADFGISETYALSLKRIVSYHTPNSPYGIRGKCQGFVIYLLRKSGVTWTREQKTHFPEAYKLCVTIGLTREQILQLRVHELENEVEILQREKKPFLHFLRRKYVER
jgi:hypothetical protein